MKRTKNHTLPKHIALTVITETSQPEACEANGERGILVRSNRLRLASCGMSEDRKTSLLFRCEQFGGVLLGDGWFWRWSGDLNSWKLDINSRAITRMERGARVIVLG